MAFLVIGLKRFPENEFTGSSKIYIGIGFAFWISSFVVLLVSQYTLKKKKRMVRRRVKDIPVV